MADQDFEPDLDYAEGLGEQGLTPDDFAQSVGQAIAQQMQVQQQPPPEVAQAEAAQQQAREIVARHPALSTAQGAQQAMTLAQHVADAVGNPALGQDLAWVEAVQIATEGAAAGVGAPAPPTLVEQILDVTSGGLGSRCLPGGGSAS